MRTLFSILVVAALSTIAADGRADEDASVCADEVPKGGEHCAFATSRQKMGSLPAAMPGAPPDARHHLGTVFFAWQLDGLGGAVTEWDIATRRALRQIRLGLFDADLHGARAGDELHLISDGAVPYWIVVDVNQLRVVRKVRLRHKNPMSIATDGSRTLIAFNDGLVVRNHYFQENWLVSALDRQGRELGSWAREDPVPGFSGPTLAVLDGRAYSLTYGSDRPGMVELSAEAKPIRQVELSATPANTWLTANAGRLFAVVDKDFVELSPDLQVLERRTAQDRYKQATGGPNGQVLAGCVHILSSSLRTLAGLHILQDCRASFWVGNVPVVVSTHLEPSSGVLISWIDPSFLGDEAAERARRVPPFPPGLRSGEP